jgi:TRAP-type C4-dicarboxylate transport system substrate-binding protein
MRKAKEYATENIHTWDFLSEETQDGILQAISEFAEDYLKEVRDEADDFCEKINSKIKDI